MNEKQVTLESLKAKVANLEEIIKQISRRTDINEEEIKNIKKEIADIRTMIAKLEIISKSTHDKVGEVNDKVEKMSDQTYEQLKELTSTLTQLVKKDSEHVRSENKASRSFAHKVAWAIVGLITGGGLLKILEFFFK